MVDSEGPSYFTYMQEVAKRIVQGEEPEVIARKTNLSHDFIIKITSDPSFDDVLEALDPRAFKEWKQARSDSQAKGRVQSLARENAVRNYEKLQELVDSNILDPKDEAAYRLKLLQVSGSVEKGVEEEIIKLTPMQMQVILQALEETDGK